MIGRYYPYGLFIFGILSAFPLRVDAWVPCLPFCDAGCSGAAYAVFGSSVQSAYTGQSTQLQSLGQQIAETNNKVLTFNQNFINETTNDYFDRITGLDASNTRMEASLLKLIKAKETLTDYKINEWASAAKKFYGATEMARTGKTFGSLSQSATGDLGACFAGEIKRANYNAKLISNEIVNVQKRYLEDIRSGNNIALSTALKNVSTYKAIEPSRILHDKSIDDEMLKNLQGLFAYMISPIAVQKPGNDGSVLGDEKELAHLVSNISLTWIASAAASVLAKRAIFGDLQCETTYVAKTSANSGNSLHELWSSKINGRITSEGYWGATKQLLPSGLRRELAYLKAEENYILYERYNIREKRNQLLAYLVALHARNNDE